MAVDIPVRTTMTVGRCIVHINSDEWEWYIDVYPGYSGIDLATAAAVVTALGFEIYEDDECDPDILDGGVIRLWMSPKEAVPT